MLDLYIALSEGYSDEEYPECRKGEKTFKPKCFQIKMDRKVVEQDIPKEVEADLSDETRVALALYLKVYSEGKVTPKGIIVPELNIYKLAHAAEVSNRVVSKTFERLRGKGFLSNLSSGHLIIKNMEEFQQWLISQGASIET